MRRGATAILVSAIAMLGSRDASAQSYSVPCNVQTLCAGVEPGGGRILNCLRAHKAELSDDCVKAVGRSVLNSAPKRQDPDSGESK